MRRSDTFSGPEDQATARAALVAAWKRDTAADPTATRFVFAYTNRDVDALNAELRQVRRDRGELAGPDIRFTTKHGPADFAPGDRVQLTDTDKRLRLYNGNVGTITAIDAVSSTIRARLDAAAGQQGREVVWSAEDFDGFRHGYAGTIYKGQGKTLDHTYLYHTHHWRAAASYVALTRQGDSAQVFVARETARDAAQLARQMAREEIKAASVAWATREELQHVQRAGERQAERPAVQQPPVPVRDRVVDFWRDLSDAQRTQAPHQETAAGTHLPPEEAYWRSMISHGPLAGPVPSLPTAEEAQAAPGILIPAYSDTAERDSLGRGLDPASIAVAATKDRVVQQERAALVQYLRGAYRDPLAAKVQLDERVKSQGWTSTAARLALDPEQIGPLCGKLGLFAGARARADRVAAMRAATAIPAALDRIAAAERRAVQSYRSSVAMQRQADAVVIPRLSARAEAAVTTLAAAPDEAARAAVWRRMTADADIAREVEGFREAVRQRFGQDALRAVMRNRGEPIESASVRPEHQAALGVVSRTAYVLEEGEFARETQVRSERLAQRQALGRRHGAGL